MHECVYHFVWVRKASLTKVKVFQVNGTVEDIFCMTPRTQMQEKPQSGVFFLMCLLTSYSGDQIKDGAFGTFVEEQRYIQFLQGNLQERDCLGSIDVDGRTELKSALKKQDGSACSALFGTEQWQRWGFLNTTMKKFLL